MEEKEKVDGSEDEEETEKKPSDSDDEDKKVRNMIQEIISDWFFFELWMNAPYF